MLLALLGALPDTVTPEVWVPIDLEHPAAPLCEAVSRRQVRVRHVDLPILRRAYRTPRALLQLARKAGSLHRALRVAHADAVYCTTSAAFIAAPVARLAGIPHVVGHVQELWSDSDTRSLTWLARSCGTIVAISDAVADSLPRRLRTRTIVVPNATPEPDTVVPLAGRTGPLLFVVASRWNGWKGHRTLLAAWDRADIDGQLVVLGGPPRSGESVDVAALVAALRRPESVSIVGEVSDPSSYIEAADVVLMPSDQPEPFGLVAIEAFARARPVIASAAGGLLDIVTPETDGWLFAPGDVEGLSGVLSTLTRAAVTVAGEQARRTYDQRFTVDQFGERWRASVREALGA